MTTYQAAEQGTNAYAKRAVLGDRGRLLITRCRPVISSLLNLGLLGTVAVSGSPARTGIVVVDDSLVSNNLRRNWRRCPLLCKRELTGVCHICPRICRGRTM